MRNLNNFQILVIFTMINMGLLFCNSGQATVSLDGEWQFSIDSAGIYDTSTVLEEANWRSADIPGAWQVQYPDLRDYQGIVWYQKSVIIPQFDSNESIVIEFKAVDYLARVYVNGEFVGEHEGGYTPFEFDVTDFVKPGGNTILLRVVDPADTEEGTEGISYWHIPHGKQNWYVQSGGIWQSVFLHVRNRRHVRNIRITSDINGDFDLDIKLSPVKDKENEDKLFISIFGPDNNEMFQRKLTPHPNDSILHIKGQIEAPRLWHPQHPHLYTVKANLNGNDVVKTRFGFRKFEVVDGKFYLNEKPIYIIGALDQDFYPETNYTTPSEKYLREEFRTARSLGLNLLRCHIKIPDERYLKVADEEGLLVWAEIPNWDIFSPDAAQRASRTFDAMLARDWNHPSLVIISLINESWGMDMQKENQRKWLKEEYNRAQQMAPDRVIVDNSACWGNFHLKTEINDYHTYWAIPENRARFDETVSEVARRPDWLFSPFGDAEETGKEALMISEFGNWGLPQLPDETPWWFERDFLDRVVTLPKNVRKRFDEFGYGEIFNNYNDLAQESQQAQFTALKYEIERIRRESEIQGYVVTEFTDINWECNGLLDMWRNPKVNPEKFKMIQGQEVLLPQPERYTYREGDSIRIDIGYSRYSEEQHTGGELYWENSQGENGAIEVKPVNNKFTEKIGVVTAKVPEIEFPQKLRFTFKLSNNGEGSDVENWCEVFVFPTLNPFTEGSINIYDQANNLDELKNEMERRGYNISSQKVTNEITLTNEIDSKILTYLKNGGRVLALVTDSLALSDRFPYKLVSREEEGYDGNWASNFNWVRRSSPLFKGFVFDRHIGFEAAYASPDYVVSDIPGGKFSDVLAGMYVGWLHLNSGYIVQIKAGPGTLLICTLNILKNYPEDPYSVNLLDRLIRYLSGNQISPELDWKF
ncbi:MAG: hypothetical protein K9M80_05380 [Candidatus Marinimicrobia bacterium]|nr:hypothetical protein [Candidatus Neomarinimicrobiota bacterium]